LFRDNVREAAVIVNERLVAVFASYVPSDAMDEPIVHVPTLMKVIAPLDESTVHTSVVALEYVFVPAPALAVPTAVGFVPTSNA
jgi:hypothetical protein